MIRYIQHDDINRSKWDIKQKDNRTLSFRSGCRSGVCGSCAIRVNGVEKLACKTIIKEGDVVTAKVIGVDPQGKIKLSLKQAK